MSGLPAGWQSKTKAELIELLKSHHDQALQALQDRDATIKAMEENIAKRLEEEKDKQAALEQQVENEKAGKVQ